MSNSVATEGAKPHMDAAGGAIAQSVTATVENMVTNISDVDRNVTVTLYTQQQGINTADFVALVNTALNSASLGINIVTAMVTILALSAAFFGFTSYRDIQEFKRNIRKDIEKMVEEKVDEKYNVDVRAKQVPRSRFRIYPHTRILQSPHDKGEKNGDHD